MLFVQNVSVSEAPCNCRPLFEGRFWEKKEILEAMIENLEMRT
jgi:hypothetical protein